MNNTYKKYPKEVLAAIPYGYYCHGPLSNVVKGKVSYPHPCPFWFLLKDRKKQENGYCVLLGKGDYEMNREPHTIVWTQFKDGKKMPKKIVKYGPHNPDHFGGLLWDGCKECGLKEVKNGKDCF